MKTIKFVFAHFILLSMLVCAVGSLALAESHSNLEAQAQSDFISELRLSAALALVPYYVENSSIEELTAIAGDINNSSELRQGAAEALKQLYIEADTAGAVTLDELRHVAVNSATSELRLAANGALISGLLGTASAEEIAAELETALSEGNEEYASLVAEALVVNLAAPLTSGSPSSILERVESVANGGSIEVGDVTLDGSSEVVQRALAKRYLSGFYIQFGNLALDDLEADLLDRAQNGATVGIREAASIALQTLSLAVWPVDDLVDLASNGGSEEYRAAAGRVLANKWTRAALNGEFSLEDLVLTTVANTLVNPVVATAAAVALAAIR